MPNSPAFDDLGLKPELLSNLAAIGYEQMTLVQARTLPKLLAGEDVLARARTGSGKTAAFGLALLNRLDATSYRVQALVLCPTRELADQVTNEDRMLDMGFAEQLDEILAYVPARRQTLLFSATYPEAISDISARVQRNPAIVDVTDDEAPAQIAQYWCPVTRANRLAELAAALQAWGGALNLVFCNTKVDCAEVATYLQSQRIVAVALHGDLEQPERTLVLARFANRSASVLVATDVAARGLDVDDVDTVINYELPKQSSVYVHRIGRTGRAGKTGIAVSLVEDREEWRLQGIAEDIPGASLQERQIPDPERSSPLLAPAMTTLQVSGGRKNKLRPGDLLGALTAAGGVPGDAVGSIDLFDTYSFVAVRNAEAKKALQQLASRPIKGRQYRVRMRK